MAKRLRILAGASLEKESQCGFPFLLWRFLEIDES